MNSEIDERSCPMEQLPFIGPKQGSKNFKKPFNDVRIEDSVHDINENTSLLPESKSKGGPDKHQHLIIDNSFASENDKIKADRPDMSRNLT